MKLAFEKGIEDFKREMVADDAEDHVDLSWYAHDVREAFGLSDDTELMFHTVAFVYWLLEEGLIRDGDLTEEGFIPWEADAAGAVERILSAWRELGRAPHLWEIVWFEATEAGAAYAEEALSAPVYNTRIAQYRG